MDKHRPVSAIGICRTDFGLVGMISARGAQRPIVVFGRPPQKRFQAKKCEEARRRAL